MQRLVWTAILGVAAGALLGGTTIEVAHRIRSEKDTKIFEKRIKCVSLAQSYEREETDNDSTLIIVEVDYSASQNSCIAAVDQFSGSTEDWQIVDLLSRRVDSLGWCNQSRDCGNGKNVELETYRSQVFRSIINGSDPPRRQHK